MKAISIFNNKGGVGKTTLTYHLGHILAEMGKKVLMIDLDPQCNLSIYSIMEDKINEIWEAEESFINDFKSAKEKMTVEEFNTFMQTTKSIHFLLSPTQQGQSEPDVLPPPISLRENLDLIAGRLTINSYEDAIAERWSRTFLSEPQALRTIFRIREIAIEYSKQNQYDYVIIDTSPSLGTLNKIIISTVDGIFTPCLPDLFSLYGIRNIGKSLAEWQKQFATMRLLLKNGKKEQYDFSFVKFLGYTIFNTKKYTGVTEWDLAKGHFHFAKQIPETIQAYISKDIYADVNMTEGIGGTSIMHTHNTFPSFAQKYKVPMWQLPNYNFKNYLLTHEEEQEEVKENSIYLPSQKTKLNEIRSGYEKFATDLLERVNKL